MKVEPQTLPGLFVLTPSRFSDARGFFSESWNKARMQAAGFDLDFVQDNHSLSVTANTVRGLHFQTPPHAQAKLVRCTRGAALDVAVDLRRSSPTYGQWSGVVLSAENRRQFLIPQGFAHGFATREPDTEIAYKCSDFYSPDHDCAIRFDDSDLGIDWDLTGPPILSDKDAAAGSFASFDSPFIWEG